MPAALVADLLVVVHFVFIAFVVFGSALVAWKPWIGWIHVPCLVWGTAAMITGVICPLTPLEVEYRLAAGQLPYQGTFIAHYVEPLVYPPGMSRVQQIAMGALFLGLNAVVYGWLVMRYLNRRRTPTTHDTSKPPEAEGHR